jgi:hypothetical protein
MASLLEFNNVFSGGVGDLLRGRRAPSILADFKLPTKQEN